jgi:hypothetical protein
MVPSLEKLIKLESPPANPLASGTPERWRQVETELGLRFPNDYKRLIDLYGVGHWVNFVEIMNPFVPWQHAQAPDFFNWARKRLEGLDEGNRFRTGYAAPFVRHPAPDGLFPFAYDDDSGTLCWQVSGQPDSWRIVCLDRKMSERFERFDMSLTGFLVALLKGEIFPRTFSAKIFPIQRPAFRPGTMP